MRSYFFILCIALNPQSGDFSGAILEVPSEALLHLSVISRSSLGGAREGIREVNLKNSIVFVENANINSNHSKAVVLSASLF